MPMLYRRLLDGATLSAESAPDLSSALDLGDYREIHLVLTVSSPSDGDAAKLVVRHAAVNEASAYLDFATPAEIALSTSGSAWFHVDTFTRWVSWFITAAPSAEAVVTLDLVAKP